MASDAINSSSDNEANNNDSSSAPSSYSLNRFSFIYTNPKFFVVTCIIELIILCIIFYWWKPLGLTDNYPQYVNMFMVFIVFTQFICYAFIFNRNILTQEVNAQKVGIMSILNIFLKSILTVVLIVGLLLFIYYFIYYLVNYPTLSTAYVWITNISIVIVGLALIYLYFKKNSSTKFTTKTNNVFKLIGQLILYIPCLLIDFIDWIKYEYKITTPTVWIVLGIEVFLIAIKFLIPILINFVINLQGNVLLKGPVYLNDQTEIASITDIYGEEASPLYNYSLSGWFWINPQPPSTNSNYIKYTNIITLGGKPAIEYNSLEGKLRVQFISSPPDKNQNSEEVIIETENVLLQRWNYIVVNYDGGTADVFLNGELIGSSPNIAPYTTFDSIYVGSQNGIEGGVCNVVFQNKIMQQHQIQLLYKYLSMMKNPIF